LVDILISAHLPLCHSLIRLVAIRRFYFTQRRKGSQRRYLEFVNCDLSIVSDKFRQ